MKFLKSRTFSGLSWLDWIKLAVPAVLLLGIVVAVLWRFVEPAPPSRVVIATGEPGGAYEAFARKYAETFRENGIDLVIRNTAGSVENYALLGNPDSGVDCAIVQGGTAPPEGKRDGLEGVCSIYYEPLWIFVRGESVDRLADMKGRKIAIGKAGSGAHMLTLQLLAANGLGTTLAKSNVALLPLGVTEGAEAILKGDIDVLCLVTAPTNPKVKELLKAPGVRLYNFSRAEAYHRNFPFLRGVTLYQGSLDLEADLPARDIALIAPAAFIACRDTTHKSVVQLLVRSAQKQHGGGTLLSDEGDFPSSRMMELPIGEEARYFLANRPNFLQRRLPFWLASLVDRLLILIVPLLAIAIPLVRIAPPVYRWRVRSKITRWYKRLQLIDAELLASPTPERLKECHDELTEIEKELASTKLPSSYMEEAYNVRLHIAFLRGKLGDYLKK